MPDVGPPSEYPCHRWFFYILVLSSMHVFLFLKQISLILDIFVSGLLKMAESLHHLDLLLQLQAKSFQETLEKHVSINLLLNLFLVTTPRFSLFMDSTVFPLILIYGFYFICRVGLVMILGQQRC